ncbi:MAG: NAD(P)H-hydrate dehydratase [Candidatus Aenigmatarchaeota archaeon]
MNIVSPKILKEIYKKRDVWSHKGMYGKLGIIAGSYFYSGSPVFVATSALRVGCDLVRIFAPECIANVIRSFLPDLIVFPYKGDFFDKKALNFVLKNSKDLTAFTIGNGMTRENKVLKNIRSFIKKCKNFCVIDADAIYAIQNKLNQNFVITPHSYEFYVLSGIKVEKDVNKRITAVKDVAKELDCTILLKGHVDVISNGEKVAINKTGSEYMTKGGFGDTLSGILGAYLARKIEPFKAACAAAYLNGLLGSILEKN